MSTHLGRRLRATRLEQGKSLRSVARDVHISPSMLSLVETGKVQPSLNTLLALTAYLGISLDTLLGDPEQTSGR